MVTKVEVTIGSPGPALLGNYAETDKLGKPSLSYCLSPALYSPRATEMQDGKFVAKFEIDSNILDSQILSRKYGQPPAVSIDVDWWSKGFVAVALCGEEQKFGFTPLICQKDSDNTVTISVAGARSGLCGCGGRNRPPFAEVGPQLSQSLPPYYVQTTPEPTTSSFETDKATATWRFNKDSRSTGGQIRPVGVWIDVPLVTRIGLVLTKPEIASPIVRDVRISISYISYIFSALVAVLVVMLVVCRVRRPAELGNPYCEYRSLKLFRLARHGGVITAGAFGISAVFGGILMIGGLSTGGLIQWTMLAGFALLLLGLLTVSYLSNATTFRLFRRLLLWLAAALLLVGVVAAYYAYRGEFIPKIAVDGRLTIEVTPRRDFLRSIAAMYVALMAMFSALVAFQIIGNVTRLLHSDPARRTVNARYFERTFAASICVVLGYMYATSPYWVQYNSGNGSYSSPTNRELTVPNLVSATFDTIPYLISILAVPILTLVAIALLLSIWLARFKSSTEPEAWTGAEPFPPASVFPAATVVSLLVALCVPWSDRGTVLLGLTLPAWVIQFLVLRLLLIRFVGRQYRVVVPARGNERSVLLSRLRQQEPAHTPDGGIDNTETSRLLELGPAESALARATVAAQYGALFSLAGIGLTLWTVIQAILASSWGPGWSIGYSFIAVVTEVVRWVVTGFAFGYLYPHIPTRTGPAKALCFTIFWIGSAWTAALFASILGAEVMQPTLYRTAQFAVLAFALGVAYDLRTIRLAGGSWRDLRRVYARHNYIEIAAVALPILLATITLINQIASGAGLEAAETVIEGVKSVVTSSG
ncbi:MAG: DUF6185 family protein [Mycolicibacterium neoaurum]|uniref:DUF6185 family protein n=1 Tax=Mycolicibacterium neoaurum TaxID=1795 RepID=UPI002FF9F22A